MLGVHAVQPPVLGMILYRYSDEFYIAIIVIMSCPVVESEDGTVLCSLVLTQYRRVTDRRTDRIAVAKTALSTAARCKMSFSNKVDDVVIVDALK